jgi:restriction endonuclease S subunit
MIDTGKNYPQIANSNSAIGLIRTQNIRPVYADVESLTYVDKSIAGKFTEANDLMFVRVGAGVGDCCIIDGSSIGFVFSDNTLRVKLHSVDPEFVAVWLSLTTGKSLIVRSSKGSGKPVISHDSINSLLIPNISTEEQERIRSSYRSIHKKYTNQLRKAHELLSGMDSYLLNRLSIKDISFQSRIAIAVRLGTLKAENTIGADYFHPERLAVLNALENESAVAMSKIEDVADFIRNIVSVDGEMPFLGLAGVVSNTGELSGTVDESEGQAFMYRKGDVLYARLRPYLNKVLFTESDGLCSTEFHVLRVKCPDILPEYLAVVMRSKIIVAQTRHMMTGNTHPRISDEDVKNLRIPLPSIDTQSEIIKDVIYRRKKARQLKRKADEDYNRLKEGLEQEILKSARERKGSTFSSS